MTGRVSYPQNPTFRCIASRHRRKCLLALNKWGPTFSVNRLAAYLAAEAQGTPSPSATEIGTMETTLVHVHLPALEAAHLISWERDEGIVQTTAHPALDDPRFTQLLALEADELDAILLTLSHEYRRIVLTVLEAERMASRTALAEEIRRRSPEPTHRDSPSVETICLSLHHAHLPMLDEIGTVEFTPTTGQATYVGHPVLETVFAIIFGRDDSAVDKLDGFLDGLAASYREASRETNCRVEWPHFWRDPSNG